MPIRVLFYIDTRGYALGLFRVGPPEPVPERRTSIGEKATFAVDEVRMQYGKGRTRSKKWLTNIYT